MVIDTDTASDDAVALVMALMHSDVTVEAVTVVAGNVPLPMAVNNALLTVERCVAVGRPAPPVHVGLDAPLHRPLETAQQIAGHESPRTTKLYDRREEEISLDEVERIAI